MVVINARGEKRTTVAFDTPSRADAHAYMDALESLGARATRDWFGERSPSAAGDRATGRGAAGWGIGGGPSGSPPGAPPPARTLTPAEPGRIRPADGTIERLRGAPALWHEPCTPSSAGARLATGLPSEAARAGHRRSIVATKPQGTGSKPTAPTTPKTSPTKTPAQAPEQPAPKSKAPVKAPQQAPKGKTAKGDGGCCGG